MFKLLEHNIFFRVLCIVLVGATCATSLYYAVNIPHLDDYDQTLGFLTRYENAEGWDKLLLIFSERNEHRTAIFRILSLIDYKVFGQINLIHLIAAINLFFIGIVVLLYKIFRRLCSEDIYFIPVLLLLAVPVWGFFNWSSAGATYGPTIFFSLLTIYLLSKNTSRQFYLAIISAMLAVVSSGGGFVIFLAAIPFLIKLNNRSQTGLWILAFAVSLVLYFYGYEPLKSGDFQQAIVRSPHIICANVLVFFGSFLQSFFGERYVWSVIFGLLVLSTTGWIWVKYKTRLLENPVVASGILLGLGFGILASIMRSDSGLGVTAAYRYRLYHILLPIFLYFFYLLISNNKKDQLKWILAISIFLFGFRWQDNIGLLETLNNKLTYGHYALQVTGSSQYIPSKGKERILSMIEKADAGGIYTFTEISARPEMHKSFRQSPNMQPMRVVKSKELDTKEYYALQGWAFLKFSPNDDLKSFVRLVSDDGNSFYFETGPFTHSKSLIINADDGFTLIIDKTDARIPKGNYKVDLVLHHPIKGVVAEQALDAVVNITE